MSEPFHQFLYQPLFNALVLLYETAALRDVGAAIILLTIAIRVLLYPFFQKMIRTQIRLNIMRPEIERIRKQHARDREKQTHELIALHHAHHMSPFASLTLFLLLLVQIP